MFHEGDLVAMRYRILGKLGQGGMGTVYRAEHVALGRQVALKVLGAEFQGTDLERRFEREARTAARLDHPGCVRVLDHGRTVDRQLYLAMELVEGPTLAAWIQESGALAIPDAIRTADELLVALAYAHGQGVLHRDVKPENVMFAKRPTGTCVVLIDFGLARLLEDPGITQQGACMGSPSYVAPERLLGQDSDERSDLYSVGIVLYEMLTGQRPFGTGEAMDIALRHLELAPQPIEQIRPDLPRALVDVVHRALDKDPDGRFPSADEMRAALARVVTGGAVAGRSKITSSIAAIPVAPPPPLPARGRPATMPPPVPAEALSTRPLVLPEASRPPSLTGVIEAAEEARPTLTWRLSQGSWWKRAVAWIRHGAWRWST